MVHLTHELIHHHYTWKDIKLSQLSELYISMMIKTLGLSLIGIFIPVYLYQLNYPISEIALFFSVLYGIRIFTDVIAAWLIGYFGPKHIMIVSHMFLVLSLLMLLSLESLQWSLFLVAAITGIANGLFFMAYHIEFSKIQSSKSAGKQIGKMYQLSKFASALGPLAGGVIAQTAGVPIVIGIAMLLIIGSAIPLSFSPEPVRKHQHITFKGFPWKKVKWDVISNSGLAFDQMTSLVYWPLYVSVFVFVDNIYVSVGLVTSIGLAASFIVAKVYGRLIDHRKGKLLMTYGVIGQSFSHFIRLLINSAGGVYLFNLVNDPMQIAVRMPYTKGLYGAASSHEGYRDAYIAVIMTGSNILRTLASVIVFIVASSGHDKVAMQIIFLISGLTVWLTLSQRYRALK